MSVVLFAAVTLLSAAKGSIIPSTAVTRLQVEPPGSPYDWGPCVMLDGGIYRMWWVRLAGDGTRKYTYNGTLLDGTPFAMPYPDRGDRIFYLESEDGRTWDFSKARMVLAPAEAEGEINHVARPAVVKVDGTFYLYYEACGEYRFFQDAEGRVTGSTEYHNQVFLATSKDGVHWTRHGGNEHPKPVVAAPTWNKKSGKQRYGFGQPSVYYRDGRFILHYVDSCTGPGDFMVRVEADNPRFENARVFPKKLNGANVPEGAVARFAQTQIRPLGDSEYLVRPAYETGRLGLLRSTTGVFMQDAGAVHPKAVFPQIACPDPRGADYLERLYPTFLTDPHGEILVRDKKMVIYYSSGAGFKEAAGTWDLFRCEVAVSALTVD